MALMIKGDMPKACNWFDENGKHRFCKVNAFCDCRTYTRGKRPSDCPIIGEIPDSHGRLVNADAIISKIERMVHPDDLTYTIAHDILKQIVEDAETIVEASNE